MGYYFVHYSLFCLGNSLIKYFYFLFIYEVSKFIKKENLEFLILNIYVLKVKISNRKIIKKQHNLLSFMTE